MLRQHDGRYDGKMSVYDKRDMAITCVFCGDLHLTLLPEGHLKKACVMCEIKVLKPDPA